MLPLDTLIIDFFSFHLCYEPSEVGQKLSFGASNEGIKSGEERRREDGDGGGSSSYIPLRPEASSASKLPLSDSMPPSPNL